MGGAFGEELDTHTWMAESLCFAPETITTLFVNRLHPITILKAFLKNKIKIMKRKNVISCIKKEFRVF